MREIKFRAKRLDNGKWVFGVPIPNSYGDRVFFIPLLLTDKIAYPFAGKPALAIPLREAFAPPIKGRGATRYIVLS